MTDRHDDLGPWLEAVLRTRQWRQVDLAREMKIDQSQVSKWIRGSRMPDVPHCEAIAKALGVPAYEVLIRAGRIPVEHRQPAQHPVREKAHVLIDRLDPSFLEPVVELLDRVHQMAIAKEGADERA